jgi:MFS family permease
MTDRSIAPQAATIPADLQRTFRHLYLDIAWYGVLSGSAIAFVAVFAARQGANGFQIGLLNAAPAIIAIMVTLPAGRWLEKQPIGPAVFWTSIFHRVVYLAWVFLPLLLLPGGQVWALIILTLLMSIPGAALAVGFNAMFAMAVPPEWRGQVVGTRNALLAISLMITSLISGLLLQYLPFPLGYQIVFAVGFAGAAASSFHLWFVGQATNVLPKGRQNGGSMGEYARPGMARSWGDGLRAIVGLRFLTRGRGAHLLRLEIWRGPFAPLLIVLFFFHLAQFLAIPIFPIFWVRELQLSDMAISLGNGLFYLAALIGSTQLGRLTERWGNYRLSVAGTVVICLYPLLMALSKDAMLFWAASFLGGFALPLIGGALGNYLLERIPEDDRPAHLAWYSLAVNTAALGGSLLGPLIGSWTGLRTALFLFTGLRLLAAVAVWRWGKPVLPRGDSHFQK